MFEDAFKEIRTRMGFVFESEGKIFGRIRNHIELVLDDPSKYAVEFTFRLPVNRLPDRAAEELLKEARNSHLEVVPAELKIPDPQTIKYTFSYGFIRSMQSAMQPPTPGEISHICSILQWIRNFLSRIELSSYEAPFLCEKCRRVQVQNPVFRSGALRLLCPQCISVLEADKQQREDDFAGIQTNWTRAYLFGGFGLIGGALSWIVFSYLAERIFEGIYFAAAYATGIIAGGAVIRGAVKESPELKWFLIPLGPLAVYIGRFLFVSLTYDLTFSEILSSGLWEKGRPAMGLITYGMAAFGAYHGSKMFRPEAEEN